MDKRLEVKIFIHRQGRDVSYVVTDVCAGPGGSRTPYLLPLKHSQHSVLSINYGKGTTCSAPLTLSSILIYWIDADLWM